MNNITIFNNSEFGNIRTAAVNGEPLFCLKDICKALDLSNPTVVAQRLEDDERTKLDLGRQGEATFITESGLYAVVLRSDKESAKRFRKWVTGEVLPSIRKNGGYIAGQETLNDDELLAKALLVAQNKIAEHERLIHEKDKRIKEMRPKEIFADAVTVAKTSILVGDLAKILKQNGVEIGRNKLFKVLRDRGYLMRCGASRNLPKQQYVENGLFKIKESSISQPDGSVRLTLTTKVTGKGQVYFVNKFLKGEL